MVKPCSAGRVARALASLLSVVALDAATASLSFAQAPASSTSTFATKWQSGTPVSATGELTVIYADDFKNQRSELVHMIRDERTGRSFQLRFENDPPGHLRTGDRIRISGRSVNAEIYVAACCDGATAGAASNIETVSQSTAAVTGDQRTLVMIANFRDESVSCSLDQINNTIFADPTGLSVDALYRDNSRGTISLSGTVLGPYTVDAISTDPCSLNAWSSAVDAQAAASGIDVASYPRKVYVLPESSTCPGGGLGTVGGNPSSAWILTCSVKGTYAHELGHNLGMQHASTPTMEYGDGSDPMAFSNNRLQGFNAPHRHQMGWLGAANIQNVSQSGVFNVAPLAVDPSLAAAPQAIKFPKRDTADYYYLSYRIPQGFDNYLDFRAMGTLSVHYYKGDGSANRTFLLAWLGDGETFADAVNGVTISLVSHTSAYATVQINFACVRAVPTLTVTPQAQSSTPGSSVSYSVSVRNNDPSACPASTFELGAAVAAGWSATVSPANLTLGPDGSGQATLTVASPPTALAGTYGATVNATDVATTGHTITGSVTDSITVPDTVAPSAPSGLTAYVATKLKQIQLSWKPAADNIGVGGYFIWRNSALVGTVATTNWVDLAYTASATNTYWITAYDVTDNVSAPSNSVTVILSSGGGKRR